MKRFSVLIVDDEPLARAGLRMLLAGDAQVVAIGEAKNGREAVSAIRERRPDLVFLDVQMPEMDGFQVVEEVGAERMPAVVFVTAHDQYAIRAFEINALDYLLKPVTAERFRQSLERAKTRLNDAQPSGGDELGRRMAALLEAIPICRRSRSGWRCGRGRERCLFRWTRSSGFRRRKITRSCTRLNESRARAAICSRPR
ncbi:MAG TPA: response regulator [Bryobacteraceae bacterium]|nr:response regulator [Bryobacteraceae bacterium]